MSTSSLVDRTRKALQRRGITLGSLHQVRCPACQYPIPNLIHGGSDAVLICPCPACLRRFLLTIKDGKEDFHLLTASDGI